METQTGKAVSRDYTDGFIDRARLRLNEGREDLEHWRFDLCISDAIESIELSAKVAFLLLGLDNRRDHEFKDDETAAVVERIPVQIKHLNFPRLFVLQKLWVNFYTLAKYGHEAMRVPARSLFQRQEAELALEHASQWVTAASVLRSTTS